MHHHEFVHAPEESLHIMTGWNVLFQQVFPVGQKSSDSSDIDQVLVDGFCVLNVTMGMGVDEIIYKKWVDDLVCQYRHLVLSHGFKP